MGAGAGGGQLSCKVPHFSLLSEDAKNPQMTRGGKDKTGQASPSDKGWRRQQLVSQGQCSSPLFRFQRTRVSQALGWAGGTLRA